MLQCWQQVPHNRPSFTQLRSIFSTMLQASAVDTYIELQVDEQAPYYRVKAEDKGEGFSTTSTISDDDSVGSFDNQKSEVEKSEVEEFSVLCLEQEPTKELERSSNQSVSPDRNTTSGSIKGVSALMPSALNLYVTEPQQVAESAGGTDS